ncbi:hypothetical protein H4217_007405 [Coemansia sp. RSA 1939]|nr:hypothetical protein H4217_007405 [Coemansia sp. RSA 1939]KAJ2607984.1 hypothetical protein EV177_005224 [Coemansia sp. RSA 1804]KAJ2684807.1 hypothetical protein GGH99_003930 [Coemansia sp. RSA 1285]
MTQDSRGSKRGATSSSASASADRTLKRPRGRNKDHSADCDDAECTGCASGAVVLDNEVLALDARELVAMAWQEHEDGADRAVVAKLYETALDKFADEVSFAHADALLRFADIVGYAAFASEALQTAEKAEKADSADAARLMLIQGRARVLLVCLNPANWRDPQDDDDDDDAGESGAALAPTDKDMLIRGLDQISDALHRLRQSDSHGNAVEYGAAETRDTLQALLAQDETRSLVGHLRIAILDRALELASVAAGWRKEADTVSDDNKREPNNSMLLLASRVAVVWALAATASSDSPVDGETVKTRAGPATKYLETCESDATACKLNAQLLVVLSSVLDDEDEAIAAYDGAIDALQRAHKLDPTDNDVVCQLEDLGADL